MSQFDEAIKAYPSLNSSSPRSHRFTRLSSPLSSMARMDGCSSPQRASSDTFSSNQVFFPFYRQYSTCIALLLSVGAIVAMCIALHYGADTSIKETESSTTDNTSYVSEESFLELRMLMLTSLKNQAENINALQITISDIQTRNDELTNQNVQLDKQIQQEIQTIRKEALQREKIQHDTEPYIDRQTIDSIVSNAVSQSELKTSSSSSSSSSSSPTTEEILAPWITALQTLQTEFTAQQQHTQQSVQEIRHEIQQLSVAYSTSTSDAAIAQNKMQKHINDTIANLSAASSSSIDSDEMSSSMQMIQHTIKHHDTALQSIVQSVQLLQETTSPPTVVSDSSVPLSDIRKLVEDSIEHYHADRTMMLDYALESAGGTVLSCSGTHSVSSSSSGMLSAFSVFSHPTRDQREIIRPSMSPGHCWPMASNQGWVIIKTLKPIVSKKISLEHIAPEIAPMFSSAPQHFRLHALFAYDMDAEDVDITDTSSFESVLLGAFRYVRPAYGDISTLQTFSFDTKRETSTYNISIHSNYGNEDYTCIYRIRIH